MASYSFNQLRGIGSAMKAIGRILLSMLLLQSSVVIARDAYDEDCWLRTLSQGKVFALEIADSSLNRLTFKLCKVEDEYRLVKIEDTTTRQNENFYSKRVVERQSLILSGNQYEKIHKLYLAAMTYNALDDGQGYDGSIWCIDSQKGSTATRACFWTPAHNPKERGLSGIHNLGVHLLKFSDSSEF